MAPNAWKRPGSCYNLLAPAGRSPAGLCRQHPVHTQTSMCVCVCVCSCLCVYVYVLMYICVHMCTHLCFDLFCFSCLRKGSRYNNSFCVLGVQTPNRKHQTPNRSQFHSFLTSSMCMASCPQVYSLAVLKWLLQLQTSHLDGTQEADELSGAEA